MDVRNKLEGLSLASFFQPSLTFVGEARSLPLSGAQAMALPTNIRLSWKSLSWTNTLAYLEHP